MALFYAALQFVTEWFYSLYSNHDNSGSTNDVSTIYLCKAVYVAALSINKVWLLIQ